MRDLIKLLQCLFHYPHNPHQMTGYHDISTHMNQILLIYYEIHVQLISQDYNKIIIHIYLSYKFEQVIKDLGTANQPRLQQNNYICLFKLQLSNRIIKEGLHNTNNNDNDLVDVTMARLGNQQLTGHKLYNKTKMYKFKG